MTQAAPTPFCGAAIGATPSGRPPRGGLPVRVGDAIGGTPSWRPPRGGLLVRAGGCHRRDAILASHTLGAQPRPGILPPWQAIRAMTDARMASLLRLLSTLRVRARVFREADGLEEVGLLVASGGAERNPRWVGWRGSRPRRGRYARCGLWHRRLFEAIFDVCARTAGSASLHPRLLIARPQGGRSCDGGTDDGDASYAAYLRGVK